MITPTAPTTNESVPLRIEDAHAGWTAEDINDVEASSRRDELFDGRAVFFGTGARGLRDYDSGRGEIEMV